MKEGRKKILFVLHTPPPVHGAAVVGKAIQDSVAINEAFQCQFINLSTSETVENVGKFSIKKLYSVLRLRVRILTAIRSFEPDLVYYTPSVSGLAFWKDCIITNAVKHIGIPVVCHFHNKGVANNQEKWLYDRAYRHFFSDIKVILLAETLYDDVRRYVDHQDLFLCANGIADTSNVPIEKEEGLPTILFLSNLIKEKGIITLLDACQIIKERGLAFYCHIVGGETEEMDAEKLNKEILLRDLDGHVMYLGKKYGIEKETTYAETDIFVFPTFYSKECFPIVLLEAMQHGLPCISTCEGGIPDIVDDGKTGLISKRRDAADLAEKLGMLITNPSLCREMGKNGRQKYEKLYTLSSFEQAMISILKKCTQ